MMDNALNQLNKGFRPTGATGDKSTLFLPLPTPFSPAGDIFVSKTTQVYIGEDQFNRNTCLGLLQAENA